MLTMTDIDLVDIHAAMPIAKDVKYLGLSGVAGVGKDFTYEYLRDHSSMTVGRIGFADGVRNDVHQYLGLANPVETFRKPYSPEVRWLLQKWGTELRRAQDPDYWVKIGMRDALGKGMMGIELVVFTDVRFKNEADAVRYAGGKIARVTASEFTRRLRGVGNIDSSHPSEIIDFDPDFYINNDSNDHFPEIPSYMYEWLRLL